MIYTGAELHFAVTQGATFDLTLTFEDGTSTPLDWTGWAARLQLRPLPGLPNPPLVDLTDTTGLTLGGVDGTIRIRLTPAQTATLPAPFVRYELKVTDAGGDVSTLLFGRFTVARAVAVLSP